MKKTNKKAKLFAIGLAFTLLIVLLRVFFLVRVRMTEFAGPEELGSNQIAIFNALQGAEKTMLYNEEGFSLALQQALYDTSAKGGYFSDPGCGEAGGTFLWRADSTKKCFPELGKIKESISESAVEIFSKQYASNNPYIKKGSQKNIGSNYEIFFEQKGENMIARAFALAPSEIPIMCNYGKPPELIFDWVVVPDVIEYEATVSSIFADDTSAFCGRYYYKEALRKELKFQLNDFAEAAEKAEDFSRDTQSCIDSGRNARGCVFDSLKKYPEISMDCKSGPSEVFWSFVRTYEKYINSETNDCIGYYTPPQQIDLGERAEETVIRITVSSLNGGKTLIQAEGYGLMQEIDAEGPYFTEYYHDEENRPHIPESKQIQYVLTYDETGKLANQELNYQKGSWADWNVPGNVMLYKAASKQLAFVDTDDYGEFIPGLYEFFIAEFAGPEPESADFCFPGEENLFTFCYDTGNRLLAYDSENDRLDIQKAKITFALSFPE